MSSVMWIFFILRRRMAFMFLGIRTTLSRWLRQIANSPKFLWIIFRDWNSNEKNHKALESIGSVATVLALATSFLIGYQSTQIASRALDVSVKQASPQFVVRLLPGSQVGDGGVEQIRIFNHGGVFYPPTQAAFATVANFYGVHLSMESGEEKEVMIPLFYYYVDFEEKNEKEGLVHVQTTEPDKYKVARKLEADFAEYASGQPGVSYGFAWMHRFLKLQYRDRFDVEHIEYYRIEPYASPPISREEGESMFSLWNNGFDKGKMANFNELSVIEMFNRVSKP